MSLSKRVPPNEIWVSIDDAEVNFCTAHPEKYPEVKWTRFVAAPADGGETITPAKTQGELMSYREGYRVGLAAGKRAAQAKVAALQDEIKQKHEKNSQIYGRLCKAEGDLATANARIAAIESQRGRE